MEFVNKILIYLRLKNKADFYFFKKPLLCVLPVKKFNSSYYGDPYSYDWYSVHT